QMVDAPHSTAPNATNAVGQPHPFVVTVLETLGDGKGLVAAPNEPVTVTLANTNGATTPATTFNVTTDSSGHASVTFTSATAGQVIGNARKSFAEGGGTLTRATGDSHTAASVPAAQAVVEKRSGSTPNRTDADG